MMLEPGTTGLRYTCPMHPQIVRDAPGNCPICGMTLEPFSPSADGANPALRNMTHRFYFAAALTVPLVLIPMVDLLPGAPLARLLPAGRGLLELLLATPVCTWAAWPFHVRAVQSVKNRSLNMFTLIGLGVSAAYVWSPQCFPGLSHRAFAAATDGSGCISRRRRSS